MSGNELQTAYLTLLRMPHGPSRLRIQSVLAGLRDEIAFIEGRFAKDVQEEFEDRAAALALEAAGAGGIK